MNITLSAWLEYDIFQRGKLINSICHSLKPRMFSVDESSLMNNSPRIIELIENGKIRIKYRVIFEHDAYFGFSNQEEAIALAISDSLQANIEEMRPESKVKVGTFAVMEEPIRVGLASFLLDKGVTEPFNFPAYMMREEAEKCVKALGGNMPNERQFEAMTRANSLNLFPFGDSLPEDNDLSLWMEFDLDKAAKKVNGFGIYGLFFGEWCVDFFVWSHAADAEIERESYVIKGGGAYFWPWQDDEWVWCMNAMRMPSCDLIDGAAVCRNLIAL